MSKDPAQTEALESGEQLYRRLADFAETRPKEHLRQLQPVLDLAASYGSLVSRAVVALGSVPPKSRPDVVIRDLIADVFEFLYEWPKPLFEGRPHVAFPLARRAYESLSLLSACFQDQSIAKRWDDGEQIRNTEIRKVLASMRLPEPEQEMRDLYRFFSKGAHPNRDLVAERFLGAGNQFVLGSIIQPELVLIIDHCICLVEVWFWFGALAGYVAKELLAQCDPSFGKEYLATAGRAAEIKASLAKGFNELLKKRQEELQAEGR